MSIGFLPPAVTVAVAVAPVVVDVEPPIGEVEAADDPPCSMDWAAFCLREERRAARSLGVTFWMGGGDALDENCLVGCSCIFMAALFTLVRMVRDLLGIILD